MGESPWSPYEDKPAGVFRSQDGGATWLALGLKNKAIKTLAINPIYPNILYAGEYGHGCSSSP